MAEGSVKKIGVMSDSHESLDLLDRAVEFFNEKEVDRVLHAGDFISPLTAAPLSRLNSELIGVFGNNDGDRLFLRQRFDEEGVGRIERGRGAILGRSTTDGALLSEGVDRPVVGVLPRRTDPDV